MSETPRHDTTSDMSACDDCHKADLTFEHEGRTDSTGATLTCESCHSSIDPAVQAAIAAGDTACASCHTGANHLSAHVSATNSGCFGVGCHDASKSLEKVHRLYAGPGSENPTYATVCDLCHANPSVNIAAAGANGQRCTSVCHGISTHSQYSTGHAIPSVGTRYTKSGCHGTDLSQIHGADPFDAAKTARCDICHTQVANWSKSGDCTGCHTLDSGHEAAHTSITQDGCSACHSFSDQFFVNHSAARLRRLSQHAHGHQSGARLHVRYLSHAQQHVVELWR